MLQIDRETRPLESLLQRELKDANLCERSDIQRIVCQGPEASFAEMGEQLLLVGEEVGLTDRVEDGIDLLAPDPHGAAVVVELKRSGHKLNLLQGLSYTSTAAKWDDTQLVEECANLVRTSIKEDEVEQILLEDGGSVNNRWQVIVLAGGFDLELVTAEWLAGKHGVDIRCQRLARSANAGSEPLSCICIYPVLEIAECWRRRGGKATRPPRYADSDEALRRIQSCAIIDFFKKELAAGRERHLRRRVLRYRIEGKRRFVLLEDGEEDDAEDPA